MESSSVKSNEEIIDELTKDLESFCTKADGDTSKSEKLQDNPGKEDIPEGPGRTDEEDANEETKEDSAKSCKDVPDDFVDEELLKDREVGLTEEEKQALLDSAQTIKNKGNELFKSGSYLEAIVVYTEGLQTCPLRYTKERSILFANRAAAKSKCAEKESAITDCTKAIELNPEYVKAYVRRAQLYEETEKLDEALEDFKKVLTLDPGHTEANYAIRRLPQQINERNEKLKTEMLGKLKDLGNMVLKPFGLSTNDFELQKDPNSDGYSVKFRQSSS